MGALTVIDLFSGCGGMSWGLARAGFRIVAGIDSWGRALRTFGLNHRDAYAIQADLASLEPLELMEKLGLSEGELDCLVGGPPCQGFSKNVPAAGRFLADPRNLLFRNFMAFAAELRPKTIVMENVAEIYNAYSGAVREEVVTTLAEFGYETAVKVVFAPDYGVPQRRRRCFFFASRTGVAPKFPTPTFGPGGTDAPLGRVDRYRSAWSAISDLPVLENGGGYEPMAYDKEPENDFQREMRREAQALYDHKTRRLNEKQFARVSALKAGEGLKELPDELRPRSGYSGAYGRLDFEMVAPTITRWVFHPGSGRYCHPREARLLTIREAARLQSFSDDFRFTGTYIEKAHQVGNAVPPLIMEALAPAIEECCRESDGDGLLFGKVVSEAGVLSEGVLSPR